MPLTIEQQRAIAIAQAKRKRAEAEAATRGTAPVAPPAAPMSQPDATPWGDGQAFDDMYARKPQTDPMLSPLRPDARTLTSGQPTRLKPPPARGPVMSPAQIKATQPARDEAQRARIARDERTVFNAASPGLAFRDTGAKGTVELNTDGGDFGKGVMASPIHAQRAVVSAAEATLNTPSDFASTAVVPFAMGFDPESQGIVANLEYARDEASVANAMDRFANRYDKGGFRKLQEKIEAGPRFDFSAAKIPVPKELESVTGSLAEGFMQYLAARGALGKFMPGGKPMSQLAKDVGATGIGYSGDSPRVADMLDPESMGLMSDYVRWLKTQPGDSPGMGRVKNMAEDATINLLAMGIFRGGQAISTPQALTPTNAGGARLGQQPAPVIPPVGATQPSAQPQPQPIPPQTARQPTQPQQPVAPAATQAPTQPQTATAPPVPPTPPNAPAVTAGAPQPVPARPRAEQRADDLLMKKLEADGITMDDVRKIQARLSRRKDSGVYETIGELAAMTDNSSGANLRGLQMAGGAAPGPLQEALVRLVNQNTDKLSSRLSRGATRATGKKADNAVATLDELENRLRTEAAPAYDTAYATPVDPQVFANELVPVLNTPSGQKALQSARNNLASVAADLQARAARGASERAMMESQRAQAAVKSIDDYMADPVRGTAIPTTMALDYTKRAFDDVIANAGFGSDTARIVGGTKRNFADSVSQATGGNYGNALGVFEDVKRLEDAFEVGTEALNKKTWQLERDMAKGRSGSPWTAGEVEALAMGVARNIEDLIEANNQSALTKLLKDKALKNVATALGSQKAADMFEETIRRLGANREWGRRVAGGSDTAMRQAAIRDAGMEGEDAVTRTLDRIETSGNQFSLPGLVNDVAVKPIARTAKDIYQRLRYPGVYDEEVNRALIPLIGKPMTEANLNEVIRRVEARMAEKGLIPPVQPAAAAGPPSSPRRMRGPRGNPPGTTSSASATVTGMVGGGVLGAMVPADDENQQLMNALFGAAGGGALGAGAGRLARGSTPKGPPPASGASRPPPVRNGLGGGNSDKPKVVSLQDTQRERFANKIRDVMASTPQRVADEKLAYHSSGRLPLPIGTRMRAPKFSNGDLAKKMDGWVIEDYFITPMKPDEYGYVLKRGDETLKLYASSKGNPYTRATRPQGWDALVGPDGAKKYQEALYRPAKDPQLKAANDTHDAAAAQAEWDALFRDFGDPPTKNGFGGKSLPMDEPSRMQRAREQGFDVDTPLYHGTTHDFDEFSGAGGNVENHHGNGAYFSTSPEDVARNYANPRGADLTNRIESTAERISDEIEDAVNANDYATLQSLGITRAKLDGPGIDFMEEARRIARGRIQGKNTGATIPAFARLKNPVVVNGGQDALESGPTIYARNGKKRPTPSGKSTRWDYQTEYDDAGDIISESGPAADLIEATRRELESAEVADKYIDEVVGKLWDEIANDEGISADAFERIMRNDAAIPLADNYQPPGQVIQNVYRALGHDGIVLKDADRQFSNMGMKPGTHHYVVFDPSNIRGKFAKFDPSETQSSKLLAGVSGNPEAIGAGLGTVFAPDADGDGEVSFGERAGAAITGGVMGRGARAIGNRLGGAPKPPPAVKFRGPNNQTFAGVNAKTADKAALGRAQNMEAEGASRDDIWDATGWFKGVDGKWRFEIDDSGAKATSAQARQLRSDALDKQLGDAETASIIRHRADRNGTSAEAAARDLSTELGRPIGPSLVDAAKARTRSEHMAFIADLEQQLAAKNPDMKLGEAVGHSAVYDAYPDMAERPFKQFGLEGGLGARAAYNEPTDTFLSSQFQRPEEELSSSLHEMQHGVQGREGFARGGSPENVLSKDLDAINQRMSAIVRENDALKQKRLSSDTPWVEDAAIAKNERLYKDLMDQRSNDFSPENEFKAYKRLAGETEARNVQTRRDFTPAERRARRPWETQDVPDDQQIVRFGGGKAESRPKGPPSGKRLSGPPKPPTGFGSGIGRAVGGGIVGGIAGGVAGEADPQTVETAQKIADNKAQQEVLRADIKKLEADKGFFRDAEITEIQKRLKREGKNIGNTGPNRDGVDGINKGLTQKGIEEFKAQIEADLERAYKRRTDLEKVGTDLDERAAFEDEEAPEWKKVGRELAPWIGVAAGMAIGYRGRAGAVKKAIPAAQKSANEANALLTPGPVSAGRTNASRAALKRQYANINEFWIKGGAGDQVPFELKANGEYKARPKKDVMPPSELFKSHRFRAGDAVVMAMAAGETGLSTVAIHFAEGELKAAQQAVDDQATPAAVKRLETARDNLALLQLAQRAGAAVLATRLAGSFKNKYPSVRGTIPGVKAKGSKVVGPDVPGADVAGADTERALLLEYLKK